MKVKILNSKSYWIGRIDEELTISYSICDRDHPFRYSGVSGVLNAHLVKYADAVITELPQTFCVKRCDDRKKLEKYIKWLNKTYGCEFNGDFWNYYGYIHEHGFDYSDNPFGTEIHIDDIIKHIDYMESANTKYVDANGEKFVIDAWYQSIGQSDSYRKCSSLPTTDSLPYFEGISLGSYHKNNNGEYSTELSRFKRVSNSEVEKYFPIDEFDLTTDEGRLAYAKKRYPVGTKVISLFHGGNLELIIESDNFSSARTDGIHVRAKNGNGKFAVVYENGKWAEIIKEERKETHMEKQKLTRKGLKEIHSVACPNWRDVLEHYGSRNLLEDYIELTQEEVNQMFNASDDKQKSVLSKYLKHNDFLDFDTVSGRIITQDGKDFISKRVFGKFENKSFYLHKGYDWKIQKDEFDELCLIPTKKK